MTMGERALHGEIDIGITATDPALLCRFDGEYLGCRWPSAWSMNKRAPRSPSSQSVTATSKCEYVAAQYGCDGVRCNAIVRLLFRRRSGRPTCPPSSSKAWPRPR